MGTFFFQIPIIILKTCENFEQKHSKQFLKTPNKICKHVFNTFSDYFGNGTLFENPENDNMNIYKICEQSLKTGTFF